MFISAKAEYACLAMMELAIHFEKPKPLRLPDLANQHGIPQRFLVQILLQLKGAGLVVSTRGSAGGYHLTRRPDQITLADILNSLQPNEPNDERINNKSQLSGSLNSVWKRVVLAQDRILRETKLSDLISSSDGGDYVI